ncbi:MAG TPA: bifunctional methylenetetrahydrofolate dehydrogenase/methenyltetrahydrofolate cyclohydrolase FolD [Gammaproteobacteria bacterium]|jgi:methylenetetrahydrofolate dehydrogenase (NADP+)/methenyltetrahydrofolate cyclohydrolase|nr:bifunctional methylenetetrahydrofolate dehydrogenase/methenyltetrahydrofolate cyclohydrolase FolD [Gammaproteobacteria bacterium]
MTAKLIDGKAFAAQMKKEIAIEIATRREEGHPEPGLAVILVGEDPASHIYVRNKRQACQDVGIQSFYHPLPNDTEEKQITDLIQQLNNDPKVHGILLQLPLPTHIDSDALLELIHPDKDVDGFNPYNLGRLAQRRPLLRPCTPYGIMMLLDSIQQHYKNQHAIIVGASNIVGRPMALELLLAGCTISVCHRFTKDLAHYVRDADILVSATGVPGLIKGEWIKPGATVIDVGIHRMQDGSIIGDIEFLAAKERAAWITPVPGGVGPMTTATLLKNTLVAANNQI